MLLFSPWFTAGERFGRLCLSLAPVRLQPRPGLAGLVRTAEPAALVLHTSRPTLGCFQEAFGEWRCAQNDGQASRT